MLERTHLRFFTLDTAQKFFDHLQLYSESILSLERSFYRVEFSRELLRASPLTILNLAFKPDARAYQYLFVLTQKPNHPVINHYGVGALNILVDAIIVRSFIKRLVRYWRNL